MPETILAIGAHNDDHIIGAGGSLIKYAKEGKVVKTLILSYGEVSHPHLKPEIIVERRIKEAVAADALMAGSGITWMGAYEKTFDEDVQRLSIITQLTALIEKEKPSKIFTNAPDDPHPIHRVTHHLVMEAVKHIKHSPEVYSFEVWNLFTLKNRDKPRLVVDTSETFRQKIKAFKAHESQTNTILTLLAKIYIRDFINGLNNKCRFAEVFIKVL